MTGYFQPYLTDAEFMKVKLYGREAANIVRSKKCSKDGCGANNTLDIVLIVAETFICIAALITYHLQQELVSVNANTTASTNVNTTSINQNASIIFVTSIETLPLHQLISDHYPSEYVVIGIFEMFGLILYISCFFIFLKDAFLYFRPEKKKLAKSRTIGTQTDPCPELELGEKKTVDAKPEDNEKSTHHTEQNTASKYIEMHKAVSNPLYAGTKASKYRKRMLI